jgi:hypothetical protein
VRNCLGRTLTVADGSDDALRHVWQNGVLKRLLFRVIARVQQLATPAVPQWEGLVGLPHCAVAPLQTMPRLKSILVDDVAEGPPFEVQGLCNQSSIVTDANTKDIPCCWLLSPSVAPLRGC